MSFIRPLFGKAMITLQAHAARSCPWLYGTSPTSLLTQSVKELSAKLITQSTCTEQCQNILKGKQLHELHALSLDFKKIFDRPTYLTETQITSLKTSFQMALFLEAKPLFASPLAKSFPKETEKMQDWAAHFLEKSEVFAKEVNLPLDSTFLTSLLEEMGKKIPQKELMANAVATMYFLKKCHITDPQKCQEIFERRMRAVLTGPALKKEEPGPFWGS
jgi:hypothetical protein